MNNGIRGIACSIDTIIISKLLLALSKEKFDFFVRACMLNLGPVVEAHIDRIESYGNVQISAEQLKALAETTIWELDLQLYSQGAVMEKFSSYEDFLHSECVCLLFFYDCGMLDFYFKKQENFDKLWRWLTFMKAEDMRMITDENDDRNRF